MSYKQKEDESVHAYYDRFTIANLGVAGYADYLVIDVFTQGLLPGPLSKKIQGQDQTRARAPTDARTRMIAMTDTQSTRATLSVDSNLSQETTIAAPTRRSTQ
ncbi:hypothetical protein LXL04_029103 [Taraxacum kok-saghyz]